MQASHNMKVPTHEGLRSEKRHMVGRIYLLTSQSRRTATWTSNVLKAEMGPLCLAVAIYHLENKATAKGGKEYIAKTHRSSWVRKRIYKKGPNIFTSFTPYSSQSNGLAERMSWTLVDKASAMFEDASMLCKYGGGNQSRSHTLQLHNMKCNQQNHTSGVLVW